MIYEYLSYFFIYSFLGWVMEVAYAAVKTKTFINRGFLNGPFCPIYGAGAISVVHLLTPLKHYRILLFLGSIAIATLIELVTGWLLEVTLKKRWWDYSDRNFNFHGYICLEFSIIWGLVCFFVFDAIQPMLEKWVHLWPEKMTIVILFIVYIYFTIDFIATVQSVLKMNKRLEEADRIGKEIKEMSNKLGLKIANDTMEISTQVETIKENYEALEALDSKEEKILELKNMINKRNSLIKDKYFGHTRLLKAFPNMQSSNHNEVLKEIKEKIRIK